MEAGAAVIQQSRENYADYPIAVGAGGATKKRVYSRAVTIFAGAANHAKNAP